MPFKHPMAGGHTLATFPKQLVLDGATYKLLEVKNGNRGEEQRARYKPIRGKGKALVLTASRLTALIQEVEQS